MADDGPPWVPRWTVLTTLASAVLAGSAYAFGSSYATSLSVVTAVGVTYVLYKWGQHREQPSKYSDDEEKRRREKEMEAEAGGYGGNF